VYNSKKYLKMSKFTKMANFKSDPRISKVTPGGNSSTTLLFLNLYSGSE